MSLPLPFREGVGGGGQGSAASPSPYPILQGEGEIHALHALLIDCVTLWGVEARIAVCVDGVEIAMGSGMFLVQPAATDMRPARWLLHTPERRAAGRPPRTAPSIVALLTALRNALGAEGGNKLRIGASAT